jgi:hypothetical protein
MINLRSNWQLVFYLLLLVPLTSTAQMAGHNVSGDAGLLAGTQAPPGFYVIPAYLNYSADTLRDGNGDRVPQLLPGGSEINADGGLVGLMWVTDLKILGGNYSFSIWPGYSNNVIEVPAFPVFGSKTSTGFSDLYVQPVSLGWVTDRADFIAGLGIYAPTGEFKIGGSENRGLGMWSYEVFGGTTFYFDRARSWHLATLVSFETHGKKDGTNARVGDLLTIEGGFGKSFMDGAVSAGIAYFGQWKVSRDELGLGYNLPGGPLLTKHERFAFGPEINIPIASKKKLYGFLGLRYLWETGAVQSLEGDSFMVTLTFPVPSIPLQ